MWWGAERVDVYVGRDQCWVGGTLAHPRAERFGELGSALERARGRGVTRVAVWLSGDLAKPFLLGPVAGLRRWQEALALAQAMAVEATGSIDGCQVVLEDWPGERPALAVASPSKSIDTIHIEVRRLKLRLQSIRPWWCRVVDRDRERGVNAVAMAIEDSDALTLLREADGRPVLARTYSPLPASDQIHALVARAALAEGVAIDEFRVWRWNPESDLDHDATTGAAGAAPAAGASA